MGGLSIKPSSIGGLFDPFECLLGNVSSSAIAQEVLGTSGRCPHKTFVNIDVRIEELDQPKIFWDVRCGQFWETRDITQNSSMSRSLCAELYCD